MTDDCDWVSGYGNKCSLPLGHAGHHCLWISRDKASAEPSSRQEGGDGRQVWVWESLDGTPGFAHTSRTAISSETAPRRYVPASSVPEAPEPTNPRRSAAALIHEHAADIQEFAPHRSAELCAYLLRLFEQEEAKPEPAKPVVPTKLIDAWARYQRHDLTRAEFEGTIAELCELPAPPASEGT